MRKDLYIVNAFTAEGKNGNPAGVMFDSDGLSEDRMLLVAQQAGVSETAFVSESSTADWRVRFFSPTDEVNLCGHATIATWSLLRSLGYVSNGNYMQQTMAGNLAIAVHDKVVFMEQMPAVFGAVVSRIEAATLLGISGSDLHVSLQPQLVSTGLKDLLIPVKDKQVLAHLQPKVEAIRAFSREHDSYSLHVFALTDGDSLASARNFDPAHGIPEECATGTSNGALLCYLNDKGYLSEQDIYRVEQGEALGQLSYIYGKFKNKTVWVGGEAEVMGHHKSV